MNKQKQKANILLLSLAAGIVSFFLFLYLARFLYIAFYLPITMVAETRTNKVAQTQNAAGWAGGTMGGLLVMFTLHSYLSQKYRRERFEKDSGWSN
jgi:hypothetical protein